MVLYSAFIREVFPCSRWEQIQRLMASHDTERVQILENTAIIGMSLSNLASCYQQQLRKILGCERNNRILGSAALLLYPLAGWELE